MSLTETYQQTAVSTQSKGRLIVMLYDGAIRFLKLAIIGIEVKNYAEKGMYINKALDIITELNAVLDMDAGGELAMNMRRLYAFMTRHLSQANIDCDKQKINEVVNLLEELNKGWRAIA